MVTLASFSDFALRPSDTYVHVHTDSLDELGASHPLIDASMMCEVWVNSLLSSASAARLSKVPLRARVIN